jgi:hypothetical protein
LSSYRTTAKPFHSNNKPGLLPQKHLFSAPKFERDCCDQKRSQTKDYEEASIMELMKGKNSENNEKKNKAG